MFDFKHERMEKMISVLAIVMMLILGFNFGVNAKTIDAKGGDRVTLNFSKNENFEVKNLLGGTGKDYKITFKKDGKSKTANFSASSNTEVNIPLTLNLGLNNGDILMGTIQHGEKLPLPAGYTEDECKWIVSIKRMDNKGHYDSRSYDRIRCYVDENRIVRVGHDRDNTDKIYTSDNWMHETASYIVIGVK